MISRCGGYPFSCCPMVPKINHFTRCRPLGTKKAFQVAHLLATVMARHFSQGKEESCRNQLADMSITHSSLKGQSLNSRVTKTVADHELRFRTHQSHADSATDSRPITKLRHVSQYQHPCGRVKRVCGRHESDRGGLTQILGLPLTDETAEPRI